MDTERSYKWFPAVVAVFVTSLITANIIAVKPVQIGPFLVPAAIIIFPLSYIFGDVLTEVYGYRRARSVIWLGFACNLIAVIAIWVAGQLPAASFWAANQPAYDVILGVTPQVLAASFIAYLVGEFLNAFVLARLKIATQGRWLWARTIGSTLIGQLADSAVFLTLATLLAGILPLNQLPVAIATQWLLKSLYEALATPLTYAVVAFLKRAEREDVYDYNTDFNPFRLEA
jgi:uncharacterized integral membrane protein (TIGR00697 family)